jgi:hypothetical protein
MSEEVIRERSGRRRRKSKRFSSDVELESEHFCYHGERAQLVSVEPERTNVEVSDPTGSFLSSFSQD